MWKLKLREVSHLLKDTQLVSSSVKNSHSSHFHSKSHHFHFSVVFSFWRVGARLPSHMISDSPWNLEKADHVV